MRYKQTIKSQVPSEDIQHFLQQPELSSVGEFIRILRTSYQNNGKILDVSVEGNSTLSQVVILWDSQQSLTEYNQQLFEAFPTLHSIREK
jgi:hypothetical protein